MARTTTLVDSVTNAAWETLIGNDPEAPLPASLRKILAKEGEDFDLWRTQWEPLREHLRGVIHSAIVEAFGRAANTPYEAAPFVAPKGRGE
mgnify:CR=1 FL=1